MFLIVRKLAGNWFIVTSNPRPRIQGKIKIFKLTNFPKCKFIFFYIQIFMKSFSELYKNVKNYELEGGVPSVAKKI